MFFCVKVHLSRDVRVPNRFYVVETCVCECVCTRSGSNVLNRTEYLAFILEFEVTGESVHLLCKSVNFPVTSGWTGTDQTSTYGSRSNITYSGN